MQVVKKTPWQEGFFLWMKLFDFFPEFGGIFKNKYLQVAFNLVTYFHMALSIPAASVKFIFSIYFNYYYKLAANANRMDLWYVQIQG